MSSLKIATAEDSRIQGRQVSRSQDPALAAMLRSQFHNDRTMAWDTDLEASVPALTGEDILSAFQRHVQLDRMTFMKGGDFANATPDPE